MSEHFQRAVSIIAKQEEKFTRLAESSKSDVLFKNELLYASQTLMNNDYLCEVAIRNPLSLRNAFSQVAALGLTLNSARQLAYLVPRDGQVILDVSWRGMVRVAVSEGAIRDCIVELVFVKDRFEYRGKRQSPLHTFNPFDKKADRGEFSGCYVEALLPDGRVHVEAVTADEIHAAREASELWRRKKKGPWVDFEDAMRKKSSIKIARKYWPQTGEKLDGVIQYLNADAGEGFGAQDVPVAVVERYLGLGQAVEPEPLPVSNAVEPPAVAAISPDRAVVQCAELEPTRTGAERPEAPPLCQDPTDLAEKVVNRVREIVRRARETGAWTAAFEHVSTWPVEARDHAVQQLKAAQYAAAREGESR